MIYESNYLEHHGIKGQKWGIRRFQNEDGSYTPEGKERYGVKSEKSEFGATNHPVGGSVGRTGSMPRGATGRMGPGDRMALNIATSYAINLAVNAYKAKKIKRDISEAHINDDKKRITDSDINEMVRKYNKKERRSIIDKMRDDPGLTYNKAKKDAELSRNKRVARNTAVFMAAHIVVPLLMIYGPGLKNKAHDALGRNKIFQEFARSMKHRKMKDAVVLRPDEYEIDKQWKLHSGRG